MEQWILREHQHRWNNEVYKKVVMHITILEDQEDTCDYDRIYIEMLIRLLIIDFKELSMTGATSDELAAQRIVQHYQLIDDILNGNNPYTEWFKNYKPMDLGDSEEKGSEETEIEPKEREELLRKFLLYLDPSRDNRKPTWKIMDEDDDDTDDDDESLFLFVIKLGDEELEQKEDQCWPKYFKDRQEVYKPDFVGKCAECGIYHRKPKCKHCKRRKTKAGVCEHCGETPDPDEVYIGTCGKCKLQHELPTCVNCRIYKQKPGNCETCGIPEEVTDVDEYLAKRNNGELEFRRLVDGIAEELTLYYQQNVSNEIKTMDLEEDARKFSTKLAEATDVNREMLEKSLCKVLPDGMTIPDDIFPIIGCVWCGSGNHDTVNCQAYLNWTQNCASAQSIDDPSVKLDLMKNVRAQMIEYHDTGKPWEFYVNLEDGEYLTPQGVKLIVRSKRILNLIPRNMQTSSVSYAAIPTPIDVANAIKLSSNVKRDEVVTLKEELQHHKDDIQAKIEDLETNVIRSLDGKLLDLNKKLDVDINQIYTCVMNDRVGQLPQQFDEIKDFLEKGLKEIQTRRLESDHVLVTLYRELFDSRTPDATIVWKRDIEYHDPNYAFRGQWRKLADRLNWVNSYNLRNHQVLPLYSKENLEYLKTIAQLTVEAMKKMFRKDSD